tara:strand:- start:8108 stop:8266 length:159 start_codon:yes stop_codon:yes gene_type:complete
MDLNPTKDYVIDRMAHLSKTGDAQGCLSLLEEFSEWFEDEEVEHLTMEIFND